MSSESQYSEVIMGFSVSRRSPFYARILKYIYLHRITVFARWLYSHVHVGIHLVATA